MALSPEAQAFLNQWRSGAVDRASAPRPTQVHSFGTTDPQSSYGRNLFQMTRGGYGTGGGSNAFPMIPRGEGGSFDAGSGSGGSELTNQERADQEWQEIRDLTIGQKDEYLNDPVLQAVQDYYQGAMQEGPYSESVQQNILNQAGTQAAATEDARTQLLQEQAGRTGGNINDPSYMAAQRSFQTDRMRGMQDARSNVALQAALENYGAQARAAGALGASRMGQLGAAAGQGNLGASYLARRHYEEPSGLGLEDIQYDVPSYTAPMPASSASMPQYEMTTEPTAGSRARVPSTTPRERAQQRRGGLIVGPVGSGARVETEPSQRTQRTFYQPNQQGTGNVPTYREGSPSDVGYGSTTIGNDTSEFGFGAGFGDAMEEALRNRRRGSFGTGGLNTPMTGGY